MSDLFSSSESTGRLIRVRVDLQKVEPYQDMSSCVRRNAEMKIANQESAGDQQIDASQHLVNCMQRHLEDNWMGTPHKVKEYWGLLLDALQAQEYELRGVESVDGLVLFRICNSTGGEFRPFSEDFKNAVVDYALLLGES